MTNKFTIISDIDDVVRDLKNKIKESMNLFYKTDKWGDYFLKNEKITDLFNWYRVQPFYHNLFKNCDMNDDLIIRYIEICKKYGCELHFLSSNDNEKAINNTKNEFLLNYGIKFDNMHFVNNWFEKLDKVINNPDIFGGDLTKIIYIDDRADTCQLFIDNGITSFWFTGYGDDNNRDNWIRLDEKYENLNYGGNDELLLFIENIIHHKYSSM